MKKPHVHFQDLPTVSGAESSYAGSGTPTRGGRGSDDAVGRTAPTPSAQAQEPMDSGETDPAEFLQEQSRQIQELQRHLTEIRARVSQTQAQAQAQAQALPQQIQQQQQPMQQPQQQTSFGGQFGNLANVPQSQYGPGGAVYGRPLSSSAQAFSLQAPAAAQGYPVAVSPSAGTFLFHEYHPQPPVSQVSLRGPYGGPAPETEYVYAAPSQASGLVAQGGYALDAQGMALDGGHRFTPLSYPTGHAGASSGMTASTPSAQGASGGQPPSSGPIVNTQAIPPGSSSQNFSQATPPAPVQSPGAGPPPPGFEATTPDPQANAHYFQGQGYHPQQ